MKRKLNNVRKEIREVIARVSYKSARISVREDTVIYVDGQQEIHEILEEPEGVLILPVTNKGLIILTREFRHNHGLMYGVPMGRKEKEDASPLDAAKRELKEEIGLSAEAWTHISSHHNGVYEEGLNHYYLVEGLSQGEPTAEDDEDIETVETSFEDAFRLMSTGEINDLRTMGCIWAGYIHLLHREQQA